jgi:hypothetical protein
VEAESTLRWAEGIVVLDAETSEDLDVPIVHTHGKRDVELTKRPAQKLVRRRIEIHDPGSLVQLLLGNGEWVSF